MATTQGDLLNHFAHFAITQKENIHYLCVCKPPYPRGRLCCFSVERE
jgi:hypothetical protein